MHIHKEQTPQTYLMTYISALTRECPLMYTYDHELTYLCVYAHACVIHMDAYRHTQTCTQAHVHKCIETGTDTHTHAHIPSHKHRPADMHMGTRRSTHTQVQQCAYIKPYSHAFMPRLAHRHTHTQRHTHMNTDMHTQRHMHTHKPSQEKAYTLAGVHRHVHADMLPETR